MPYSPVEDIPDIETSSVNIKKRDPLLYEVIESTRFALRHRYNFKKRTTEESTLIAILRSQLLLYKTTHKSIRLVLRHAYREKDYTVVPDASSLLREQVEKIYIIALFLDNPAKWVQRYFRSAWRTDFEGYCLELEEYGEIERHKEFLGKHYPEYLSRTQRIRIGKVTETIVSDFARRALKYKWENPGDERPAWFVQAQKRKKKKFNRLRDYIRDYFEFPTPGRAASMIKNKLLKSFLYRWHKEYSSICQYSHVAFGKMTIPVISEFKDMDHAEKLAINGKRLAEKTVFMSHIAAATACALVVNSLKNTYGAKAELREFWEGLYMTSLPGKAFWNMYIKKLLS
jgi:hypothetical protein